MSQNMTDGVSAKVKASPKEMSIWIEVPLFALLGLLKTFALLLYFTWGVFAWVFLAFYRFGGGERDTSLNVVFFGGIFTSEWDEFWALLFINTIVNAVLLSFMGSFLGWF